MSRSKLPAALRTLHEVAEREGMKRTHDDVNWAVLYSAARAYALTVRRARKERKGTGGDGKCGVCKKPVECAATGRPRKFHDECYSLRREELA